MVALFTGKRVKKNYDNNLVKDKTLVKTAASIQFGKLAVVFTILFIMLIKGLVLNVNDELTRHMMRFNLFLSVDHIIS